jgi:hypothetical protein
MQEASLWEETQSLMNDEVSPAIENASPDVWKTEGGKTEGGPKGLKMEINNLKEPALRQSRTMDDGNIWDKQTGPKRTEYIQRWSISDHTFQPIRSHWDDSVRSRKFAVSGRNVWLELVS